jgi:hypothetical protein
VEGTWANGLVVEAGEPVPWNKPVGLAYDPHKPVPPLTGALSRPDRFLCFPAGRRQGVAGLLADGSVCFIDARTDEATVQALITRDGSEPVDVSKLE